ncbi:hypothetical protein C0Q70_09049 [Pomacea canaliculata]|uniref:Sodium/solute symporter n=1 Tax=Pomacea canaliculata TaxID=400727 RepID=A0A2T7P8P8_POMCA|nr:hypothetical protein C0Q70_09049 [Pomacea canaliculata]
MINNNQQPSSSSSSSSITINNYTTTHHHPSPLRNIITKHPSSSSSMINNNQQLSSTTIIFGSSTHHHHQHHQHHHPSSPSPPNILNHHHQPTSSTNINKQQRELATASTTNNNLQQPTSLSILLLIHLSLSSSSSILLPFSINHPPSLSIRHPFIHHPSFIHPSIIHQSSIIDHYHQHAYTAGPGCKETATGKMNYLHWFDYVVMAALMVVSLGIGIFFAVYKGGQRTKVEYLLGNRQMSMIPVCLSIFVTFQSAITLIGGPADMFNTGTMYMFIGYGIALSYIVGLFTCGATHLPTAHHQRLRVPGDEVRFQVCPTVCHQHRHAADGSLHGGGSLLASLSSTDRSVREKEREKGKRLSSERILPHNLCVDCDGHGVLLYAYVVTIGCDPYQAGIIDSRNQMMPYFVPSLLGSLPGMPGLYMSMLFSGTLSTLSSGVNALGANTVEDLLARPLRGYKDVTVTVIAKITVLLYGGLTIGLAYLARSLRGPVTQMSSTAIGACGGPISGIFYLAGMVPWANKYGAIAGGVIGIVINIWIAVGAQLYGAPTRGLPPGPTHNCSGNNSYSLSFYNLTTVELPRPRGVIHCHKS